MAVPSVTRSPLVHLGMLKERKWVTPIYLIIKYVYLRIKRISLIQGYLAIKKRRENPQLFGAGGPQVPILSQNYVLVMVKAGSDAANRNVLARKISLCEGKEQW